MPALKGVLIDTGAEDPISNGLEMIIVGQFGPRRARAGLLGMYWSLTG